LAPVKRLERITRERDRPANEDRERKRRKQHEESLEDARVGEDGQRHIDIRA
jgi:hypothetical protein